MTATRTRTLRWSSALTLCLLLASPLVHAADKDGRFSIKGVGLATCEQYLAEAEKGTNFYFMFGGWLDGYLSAINQAAPQTYDVAPWQVTDLLAALIADHCKEHPKQRFFAVVNAMAGRLMDDRLQTHSDPIEAKAGDKTVKVYKEVMRRAQEALQTKGFYSSTLDGLFGPNTQKAFEAYQRKEGLEVTGLPDQLTLLRLLEPFGPVPTAPAANPPAATAPPGAIPAPGLSQ